ncbi:hypothetical protein BsWGS_07715 [Bradybaena similaris]
MEIAGLLEAPPCLYSNPNAQYPPFPPLLGEHPLLISKTVDGSAMVTNFRFCVCEKESFINIPLMLVGDLLVSEAAKRLGIVCKDGSTYSCTFATTEDCQAGTSMLREKTGLPQSPGDLFAYRFHVLAMHKQSLSTNLTSLEEENIALCRPVNPSFAYNFDKETERLQFDTSKQGAWRKSHANKNYEFCPTYPKFHILPAAIDDDRLKVSLDFRAIKRFPSVVWRDRRTGMVLIRSSQPLSSFLGVSYFTNQADVSLIEEIVNACNRDWQTIVQEEHRSRHSLLGAEVNKDCDCDGQEGVSSVSDCLKADGAQESLLCESSSVSRGHSTINGGFDSGDSYVAKKLAIVDCRSLAGVWGNSFKGGGTEDEAIYKCNTVHLDLANIHNVRDSFNKLRILCHAYVEGTFLKSLSSCMWPSYISALLRGANIVVELMHVMKRPVLVHCSDGWDRTSQIVSLSELMMDSYYRTIEGFQVLVEREWLHFGHKFGERGGHDPNCSDTNQISPIFLQFLDCVYQLTLQYPARFQFTEAYLVKLLQHSYACLFGNFLHNCQKERDACQQKTASVWALLQPEKKQFVNLLYKPSDQVLKAKFSEHDIVLWKSVYMGSSLHISQTEFYSESSPAAAERRADVTASDGMIRSKSLVDLSKVNINSGYQNITQGHGVAAASAAARLDTSHVCNKSSSTHLLHSLGESLDGRTSPLGAPEENGPDSSHSTSHCVSTGTEYGSDKVVFTSHGSGSSAKASLVPSISKSSMTSMLSDALDEASQTSAEQKCLIRHGNVPPNGTGGGENSDPFLAIHQVDQNLVTSTECCLETVASGPCDGQTNCGFPTECCGMQTLCCDKQLEKINNAIGKADSVEAGLVDPDNFEADLVNSHNFEAGLVNPDNFEAVLGHYDNVEAVLGHHDNVRAGSVNLDSFETGLVNPDNSEAGLANPDSFEAENLNSYIDTPDAVTTGKISSYNDSNDSFYAGIKYCNIDNNDSVDAGSINGNIDIWDSFKAEVASSDIDSFKADRADSNIESNELMKTTSDTSGNWEAGDTNSLNNVARLEGDEAEEVDRTVDSPDSFKGENINSNIDNPDCETANTNCDIDNLDSFEASNVSSNIDNLNSVRAENSNINNTQSSEAGNINIDKPDMFEAENTNSKIDNADNFEAENENNKIDNTDNFEAENTNINPDRFEVENTNIDDPDCFQAGKTNSNIDIADSLKAENKNIDSSDTFGTGNTNNDSFNNFEAGNADIDYPDSFEAGNSYIDNPQNFAAWNTNHNINNAGSFKPENINGDFASFVSSETSATSFQAETFDSNSVNVSSFQAETFNSNSVNDNSFQAEQANCGHFVSNRSVGIGISVIDLSQKIYVNGSATSGYNSEKTSLSSNSSSLSGETDGALNDVFESTNAADEDCQMKYKMRHNGCENSVRSHNNCDDSQWFVKSSDIINNSTAAVKDITPRYDSQRTAVNSTNVFSCCNGSDDEIHSGMVGATYHNSDLFLFNSLDSVEINDIGDSRTFGGCDTSMETLTDEAETRTLAPYSTSCYTKPLELATQSERLTSANGHVSSSSLLTLHVSPKKWDSQPSEMSEAFYESNVLSRLSGTAVGASQRMNVSPVCLCRRSDAGHQHHPSRSEVISRRLLRATVATSTTDISDSSIAQPSPNLLTTPAVTHQPRVKKHIDVDGLTLFCDERQDLVAELLSEKDCKILELERHLSLALKYIHNLKRYSSRQLKGSLCDNFVSSQS